jgi:hypothetical protein
VLITIYVSTWIDARQEECYDHFSSFRYALSRSRRCGCCDMLTHYQRFFAFDRLLTKRLSLHAFSVTYAPRLTRAAKA